MASVDEKSISRLGLYSLLDIILTIVAAVSRNAKRRDGTYF